MARDIVGKKVRHKTLGVGTIISQDRRYIKVMYEKGEKEHNYLDAFKSFLEMVDDEVEQKEIDKEVQQDCEAEASKAKKEAEQIEHWKKYDEENKKNKPITRNRGSSATMQKINDCSNVAFKCTYCDGGKTFTCIGFNGVCSDKMINYNINVAKKVWCGQDDCICKMYYDGEFNRYELEAEFEYLGSACYESVMFKEWRAAAGTYHHGDRAGQPIKLKKAKVNSLCVLTTREPNTAEHMRIIFGVFLIDETFEGNEDEHGEVVAHPKFRLALTPKEARRMLYWKYHRNESSPDRAMWGTGLFRYFTNKEAVQILRDIAELKKGTKDEELAKEFLTKFCSLVKIKPEEAGFPKGALY